MAYEEIFLKTETARCLLCHSASCTQACVNNKKPDEIIRSLRFENIPGAVKKLGDFRECEKCSAPCMESCIRGKIDSPVDIKGILKVVNSKKVSDKCCSEKADLSVDFCGVHFENPFLLSSSIVGSNYDMIAKSFDMGWAGVAFKTIGAFIPEEVSPRFSALEKEDNPFIGFKNIEQISDHSLEENIGYIKKLKLNYPSKIIVASIMGRNDEEWTYLASKMEEAQADIIECNFSCPHMSGNGLGSDVGTNPALVAQYVKAVRKGTKLPVLAKMTPNITNMEIPAIAAIEAGADGIAAINTIKSVMNVNLNNYESEPNVAGKTSIGGYSGKAVKPIALRFITEMKQNDKLKNIPISGMGGIENWKDAAEFIALGCGTVQVTTAIMQYGYRIIDDLIEGLSDYMIANNIDNVESLKGRALENIVPTDKLNRHSISYPKFDRQLCVGCGRCYLSCYDGGHQAITIDEKTKKPVLDAGKCVGCQLCRLVCPVKAINSAKRIEGVKAQE